MRRRSEIEEKTPFLEELLDAVGTAEVAGITPIRRPSGAALYDRRVVVSGVGMLVDVVDVVDVLVVDVVESSSSARKSAIRRW